MHLITQPQYTYKAKVIEIQGEADKPIVIVEDLKSFSINNRLTRQKINNAINKLDLVHIYRSPCSTTSKYTFS